MSHPINPENIMRIGMGFMASRALLTAVEFGLFTYLAGGPRTAGDIAAEFGLRATQHRDWLDALVSLGLLGRVGDGDDARYENTPDTAVFLDRGQPTYLGGMLEMASRRLYPFWTDLGEALVTGEAQNEAKGTGKPLFESLYQDPDEVERFLAAMAGVQVLSFRALLQAFDFSRYDTVADIGGASARFSILAAQTYPDLRLISYDLEPVRPIARRFVAEAGLTDRIDVVAGDFLTRPLPAADVVVMGNILHDWGLDTKKLLIRRAHDALPDGGAFVVLENIIDDQRRTHTLGMLISLNMLIETGEGFDYTGAQFDAWCREIGFASTEVLPLGGPISAAVAYK